MPESFNILVSSAGRRVILLRSFRESLRQLGVGGSVHASDLNACAAAFHDADEASFAPLFASGEFIDTTFEICRRHDIKLVIPTIDPELPLYAAERDRFANAGINVVISGPETVAIGNDKVLTTEFLNSNSISTPRQCTLDEFESSPVGWEFPLLAKPRRGSSSIGVLEVRSMDDLRLARRYGEMVVQKIAPGREYTVDVFIDQSGAVRCCVPRLRIETRGGEVSKGMTERVSAVQELARQVCEALPDACGVLNVQIFYDVSTGQLNVIEINPRFGGGYPLSHHAGAPFTTWLIEEALGISCNARDDEWRDGLVMLRYDDAIFVHREDAGL